MRVQHIAILAATLVVVSLVATSAPQARRARPMRPPVSSDRGDEGLAFRLEDSVGVADDVEQLGAAPATALSERDAARLLSRLEPLEAGGDDEKDFALPSRSLPPPRTGDTVATPFPPPAAPDTPPTATSEPVRVLRFAPEGDVGLAPHLSVTFSAPMVAVTSHDALSRQARPVRLTPEPKGTWRWIGTRTLLFEPEARFPMATRYEAEVPAGTRSAMAGTVGERTSWSFATPPPGISTSYPTGGPHPLTPVFFIAFDQAIDRNAVLARVRVKAGRKALEVREASEAEIQADEGARRLVAAAEAGRWVAFRSRERLPADSHVTATVTKGTPSAEGPLTTTEDQSYSFRTYAPLRIEDTRCAWDRECPPLNPWTIEFNNPLDLDVCGAELVTIEPELPDANIDCSHDRIFIKGRSKGRTRYRVRIDGKLADRFGQTLGEEASVWFDIGSARSVLTTTGGAFVVLDPAGKPRYPIYTVNHARVEVAVYAVGPEDLDDFRAFLRGDPDDDDAPAPPGRLLQKKTVEIEGEADELVETSLDLAPFRKAGHRQLVVVVQANSGSVLGRLFGGERRSEWARTWIQLTDLGVDAFVDQDELYGLVTSLRDGRPLQGVTLSLVPGGAEKTTNKDGLAVLPLASTARPYLVARKGDDIAILPQRDIRWWWSGDAGFHLNPPRDSLRWHVFDDRGMYRPGEELRLKGWVRHFEAGPGGDIVAAPRALRKVSYIVRDSRGNKVDIGTAPVSRLGGFSVAVSLPEDMNLGYARIELEAQGATGLGGTSYRHSVQVQEFRRPEFEVSTRVSSGPHIVGGEATATVSAQYYAGGGLPGAETRWQVTSSTGHFVPPGRGDFVFGTWTPWWRREPGGGSHTEHFSGETDTAGEHHLRIHFDAVDPPRPTSLSANATVTDVNRQAWSSQAYLLVHPASEYVGLKTARTFVEQGKPIDLDLIVADLDGKLVTSRAVHVTAERLDWVRERGKWTEKPKDRQTCDVRSGAKPVRCTFKPKAGGRHRITAHIEDEEGRPNESELTVWVAGGRRPPRRDIEKESVELIPDREEYRDGETAEILIQAPFYPATGFVTFRRSGIVAAKVIRMDGPTHTLRVPIKDAYVPNLHVSVYLSGSAPREGADGAPDTTLPRRPAFAGGSLNLRIPPFERTLAVSVEPRDKALEPGAKTRIDLTVKGPDGGGKAGAEVAVVVVDEAVLALTGYTLADPVATFYSLRGDDTSDYHLRSRILLAQLQELDLSARDEEDRAVGRGAKRVMLKSDSMPPPAPAAMEMAEAEAVADDAPGGAPIRVRSDFRALALYLPEVRTDGSGRATVDLELPDNLTRYRVMAVAVAGTSSFGKGESTLTARLPLMVRPSPPRFLNFGDTFELPIVLQNQTDAALSADVAVRATNASLRGPAGKRVRIPANDRVEVRFPMAAEMAGTARFQVAAAIPGFADAATFSLPVWTPATTEAFATYGDVTEGAVAQPVAAPPDVFPQFGGLEITTSSTALQALTDAVLYLVAYPYECAEQLSSRILAVAALRDVLSAFEAEGLPSPEAMLAAVDRDVARLQGMQNSDGGFAFWRRGYPSWPYISIHVTHALARAKAKGFDIPSRMLSRAQRYLENVERYIPHYYSKESRWSLIAYALHVRRQLGDTDTKRARKLVAEATVKALPFEALGWLLPVLADGDAPEVAPLLRRLGNAVAETAATAHFVTSYSDGAHVLLHSNRRVDGIVLDALLEVQPQNDLIPKVTRGLLAHRTRGRWGNTQENAFVLLALDRYFATYEKETPNFLARAWLGERFVGEHRFKGRTTERHQIDVPMRYLAEADGPQTLVLQKKGPGRMYYRVGMRYAPTDLKLPPSDHGFTVERVYEAVDDPGDVRRDADGTWHVKAGAKVRIRLTMVAEARRYHVALVDPLPAGLEPLNPALRVSEPVPADPKADESRGGYWWWWRPWFEHQNMRDERVEAFTSLLWEGVHTYTYVTRATTPGRFVVPPPKAEEMYHPETFGRGAGDILFVE